MSSEPTTSVAVIDDDVELRLTLRRYLSALGCEVKLAGSLAEARTLLARDRVDVALVDFQLPDGDGPDLIPWLLGEGKARFAYCMTGHATVDNVVKAMRGGALDVLQKPFDLRTAAALVAKARPRTDDLALWREQYAPDIVGDSAVLAEALRVAQCASEVDATVLVTGESGTGKELVARALHRASSRRDGPFVAVNCAAIPEALLEAELFGHTRGAFTGAVAARDGRLQAATGGTLFLDEIGDLPLAAQAKLLRVMQDRMVTPVGADRETRVDVRVVAATHRDLEEMVELGTFRADLYFRLTVLQVELPALRDRREDILPIARYLLTHLRERLGRAVTGFDSGAEDALRQHAWPGNVRELANIVERAVVLRREGTITTPDLQLGSRRARRSGQQTATVNPAGAAPAAPTVPLANGTLTGSAAGPAQPVIAADGDALNLRTAIDSVERQLIQQALERTNGNRTEAAALLGLNRTTLVEKLRRLGG
jgi:two-component system response regulator PilR (NtrC family)